MKRIEFIKNQIGCYKDQLAYYDNFILFSVVPEERAIQLKEFDRTVKLFKKELRYLRSEYNRLKRQ